MTGPKDESVNKTVAIRKELKPFGGINGQVRRNEFKEEALRTKGRQYCFERGFITAKDLDDEELVAGRCRDANGRIPRVKGKTELIPRHLYDEMVAEHELRYKHKLRERLDQMLDIMTDIAEDETVEPRDRFEAAKYIFERTAGKTPDTVNVTVKAAPWEDLLNQVTGIAPMSREEHRRLGVGIVDAEVIDYGEEEGQGQEDAHAKEHSAGYDDAVDGYDGQSTIVPAAERPEHAAPDDDEDVNYWTEGDIHTREEPHQSEPELNYGRRADEKRSYAQQAHDAQSLAKRRKEARERIQNAKKQRKIARATGADAIDGDITGAELGEDGKVRFE
jgi:hypothetical protein